MQNLALVIVYINSASKKHNEISYQILWCFTLVSTFPFFSVFDTPEAKHRCDWHGDTGTLLQNENFQTDEMTALFHWN